jgi:DNA modification methylase
MKYRNKPPIVGAEDINRMLIRLEDKTELKVKAKRRNINRSVGSSIIQSEVKVNIKEKEQRARTFNGLTASEWTALSRNVWNDLSSPREPHHLEHGAVYPVKLVSRLVNLYSRKEDWVIDPFLGVGSTVVGAIDLERNAVGIELNPRFVEIARQWVKERRSLLGKAEAQILQGDCRSVLHTLPSEKFQLLITSPPYADFIHRSVEDRTRTHKTSIIRLENNSRVKPYSDSPEDFGNMPYPKFLRELEPVFAECYRLLRPGGYQVWIVKDHRDTRSGIPYIAVHSDLANIAKKVGLVLHDIIIWDQNEQRRLVLLGYPSVFYTNQNCSFLVVFRKPKA